MPETNNCIEIKVTEEDRQCFKRTDHFLIDRIPWLGRSLLKKFSSKGKISPANLELKKMPPAGTLIVIPLPPPPPEETIKGEDVPFKILHEDKYLLIIDKPAGIVTHPAPGNQNGTLVHGIIQHCPEIKRVGDKRRPGIVHRLDKGTSGVIVVGKEQKCYEELVLLFSTHNIERVYLAIVAGKPNLLTGTLTGAIGRHPKNRLKMKAYVSKGKQAITHYKIIDTFAKASLLKLTLETGRTHQIRVHLSTLLKTPILCDPLYKYNAGNLSRQTPSIKQLLKEYPYPLLHAQTLGFTHPITKEKLLFSTPPPKIFQKTLELLKTEK